MTREQEIAWAAGLFEGEGSMTLHESGGNTWLAIQLSMVDRDVVERFHQIVGAGTVRIQHRKCERHNTLRTWRVGGADAAEIIIGFLPYFGERRRARALDCLRWFRDQFTHECEGCGRFFVSAYSRATCCSRRCWERWRFSITRHRKAVADLSVPRSPRQQRNAEVIARIEEFV